MNYFLMVHCFNKRIKKKTNQFEIGNDFRLKTFGRVFV